MSVNNSPLESLIQKFQPLFLEYWLTIDPTSPLPITGKVQRIFGNNNYDIAVSTDNNLALYDVSCSDDGAFLYCPAMLVGKVQKTYNLKIDKFLVEVDKAVDVVVGNALYTPDYPGFNFRWPVNFFEVDRNWEPPVYINYEE